MSCVYHFFFFKQKTAYEMRISDWSSDVCSSDLFAVARIAGIQAAKKTSDLIPLCHPLMLTSVKVELNAEGEDRVRIVARCKLSGQTGVEMEALTAASVAALTIYDMCKAEIGRASCRERVCQYV